MIDFNDLAKLLTEQLQSEIREYRSLRKSNLIRQARVEAQLDELTIVLPDYATFVNSGRRAGSRMPPVDEIERWVREKNIGSVSQRTSIAWAIAKSIQENGIEPRPFLDNFERQLESIVLAYINSAIDDILSDLN